MDRLRVGRSIRAIRVRLGLRQVDLAARAQLSRSYVSNIERGLIGPTDFNLVERLCGALGAELEVRIRWRGEGLDRLLDEAHAGLVDAVVRLLHRVGWDAAVEVTFNHFGERGSVDVLAWHAASRHVLVVEVKSVIPDAQATLMPLDRKARLAREIGRGQGWDAAAVSKVLIVQETSANRRRVDRVAALFDAALPVRGRAFRRWLREPFEPMAALCFLSDSTHGGCRRSATGRRRVRRSIRLAAPP